MTEDKNTSHTENFKTVFSKQIRKLKLEEIKERQKVQQEISWIEKQVHCLLGFFSGKYRDWIYNYKGFLSKEDGYLDYNEWHVTFLAAVLGIATFHAPTQQPIGLIAFILMTAKAVRNDYGPGTSIAEISKELPYWIGVYVTIVAADIYIHGHSLSTEIPWTTIVFKAIGLPV